MFEKYGNEVKERFKDSWYQWTKNGNFAIQYGAVEKSGTADRAYHVQGAQARIQSRFGKIKQLNEAMINQANRTGYVETIPDKSLGCKRGYPLLCTRSQWGSIVETVPLNYHVQGTAMWWMMKAMIRCYEYLQKKEEHYMIMQVHDELVFDFPKRKGSNRGLVNTIKRLMECGGSDIGIPTPVSREKHLNNWGE